MPQEMDESFRGEIFILLTGTLVQAEKQIIHRSISHVAAVILERVSNHKCRLIREKASGCMRGAADLSYRVRAFEKVR
jgi:hypothetical protein